MSETLLPYRNTVLGRAQELAVTIRTPRTHPEQFRLLELAARWRLFEAVLHAEDAADRLRLPLLPPLPTGHLQAAIRRVRVSLSGGPNNPPSPHPADLTAVLDYLDTLLGIPSNSSSS